MSNGTPIKLTDEIIDEIRMTIRSHHKSYAMDIRAEQIDRAIRTLRDRARAVVDSAGFAEETERWEIQPHILRALREVLPEAKP